MVINIDCCLTILNLLPAPLHWEIAAQSHGNGGRDTIDGSTHRDGPLQAGKFAEILGSRHVNLLLRLRSQEWSSWIPLVSVTGTQAHFQSIALKDKYGVPLVVGVRSS